MEGQHASPVFIAHCFRSRFCFGECFVTTSGLGARKQPSALRPSVSNDVDGRVYPVFKTVAGTTAWRIF